MNNKQQKYVLIKHPLKLVGQTYLNGAKFRNGVAVVQVGSKVHRTLSMNPVMKCKKELGLERLLDYGFKSKDILLFFGKDVYAEFKKAVEAQKAKIALEALEHIESPKIEDIQPVEAGKACVYVKKDNTVCANAPHQFSKTGNYCFGHLRYEKQALEQAESNIFDSSELQDLAK